MVPRHVPSTSVEFIGGPLDGRTASVRDDHQAIRVLLDEIPRQICIVPKSHPTDSRCRTGTYIRDRARPRHFIWDGED